MNERLARMDMGVFIAVLALLGFGVVLVYSSSFAIAQERFGGAGFFLERQVVRVLIALVCFVVCINVDYHAWSRVSGTFFVIAIALLLLVLVMPGHHAVNGAKRWLVLGSQRFQVSELARLALVIAIASRSEAVGDQIREWRTFLNLLARIGAVCALVVVEPDFSTAVVIGAVGLAMVFIAGARLTHVVGLILVALPTAAIVMFAAPYRRARLMAYMGAPSQAATVGYQSQQALIGLGNGGLFGVGLGQGREKLFYLPEPHTDFAFSILGEEIGLVGLAIVLLVFAFIVYRGFRIAAHAPDRMGQVLAFGATLVLATYVLVHVAVNVGLVPTTGLPMPLLSYGGINIILTMMSLGIVLNISSQAVPMGAADAKVQRERLRKFRPQVAAAREGAR